MQGWQTPYLGLRDLPRELSEFELQAFFSFPKMRFKVTNWAEYEAGLRRRGSLTFWITESAIDAWSAAPRTTPGGQASYSDSATQICLMLRTAFKLALRAGPRIDTKMARNPSRGGGSPLKECIHLFHEDDYLNGSKVLIEKPPSVLGGTIGQTAPSNRWSVRVMKVDDAVVRQSISDHSPKVPYRRP
jgi:hypothetical protein